MKSLLRLFLWIILSLNFIPAGFAQSTFPTGRDAAYPKPSAYVVDESGVIDSQTKNLIEGWLLELKQKTTAEVAVVVVDSTGSLPIEEYAVNLFQRFGIGQKGKDNGVLFLVAFKDHHMRIEVGYGLEGAVTDAYSSRIINTIVAPEFKQGNYSAGIEKGAAAIVSLIAKEYNVTLTGVPQPTYSDEQGGSSFWMILLILCIFISFFFSRGRGGMFFPGGYYSGGYGGGGGGFSGGFGGFGGGSSGGGGASGSW